MGTGQKYVYNLTFCSDGGGAGKVDPNPEILAEIRIPMKLPEPVVRTF